MSDIKPGDLVVIVRDCCGRYLGKIYTVGEVAVPIVGLFLTCIHCGWRQSPPPICGINAEENGQPYQIPLTWLKKIPPLSELEQAERETEVVA